eukprot:SAG25_NODE_33_length_20262_cov_33.203293_14_plen_108_part_00
MRAAAAAAARCGKKERAATHRQSGRSRGSGGRCSPTCPKRRLIEARWGSKQLAFAGKLQPRRLIKKSFETHPRHRGEVRAPGAEGGGAAADKQPAAAAAACAIRLSY